MHLRWRSVFALVVLLAAASVVMSAPALAGGDEDYADKDFGLRFASAFVRFRDVISAGGLSAANRWPSAINPASSAWSDVPGRLRLSPAAYYSAIDFDAGTRLDVIGLAATWQSPGAGTWQPAVSQIRSNDGQTTRQGLLFDYEVDSAQLQWANRWRNFAFGASVNYANAITRLSQGPIRVVDSDADSFRFRAGALFEPCHARRWLFGVAAEYGFADFTSDNIVVGPVGPMPVTLEDTDTQVIVNPAVSYQYGEYSTVALDYTYGRFAGDGRGVLNMHRFTLGVDHQLPFEWLFVRPSVTVDARGNIEAALGLSIQFAKWGGIDFAYKHDALPELRNEFGESRTFQVLLSLRF